MMDPKHRSVSFTVGIILICACGGTAPSFDAQGGAVDEVLDASSGMLEGGTRGAGATGGTGADAPWTLTAIASGQTNPMSIAVDAQAVYWADSGDPSSTSGAIVRQNLKGGPLTLLASGAYGRPFSIATDSTNIYWAAWPARAQWVMKTPIGNGGATPLTFGELCPKTLAVDSSRVYWTNSCNGTLMACGIDGCKGQATLLVSGQRNPWGLAVVRSWGLAVDSPGLYWTNNGDGTVMRCAASACPDTTKVIADGQTGPTAIVADSFDVFWLDSGGGTVMKAPLTGGHAEVLAAGQNDPSAIALDDVSVYWIDSGDGTVMAAPKGGEGCPTLLSSDQNAPQSIAVSDSAIYWTNAGDGTVMRLTKGAPRTNSPGTTACGGTP